MKKRRFRINDLGLTRSIICFSLIFNLTSLIFFTPSAVADTSVSATVPPRASDFQFTFASDGQTNISQGTILSYTLTYGAQQSAGVPTNTTIVANFSNDQAPDASDVLDYVIGSATNAYNSTQPVVDLNNRTITWTIPNLPAGTTDQEVTFQLKTNSNYTGTIPVNFTVAAGMSNQYVTLPNQTIHQTYLFDPSLITPTPTPTGLPTPTPTAAPGPTSSQTQTNNPTATPTPQPTISANPSPPPGSLQISNISFPQISAAKATILVNTNTPSQVTLSYGTSPDALDQTSKTTTYTTSSLISLTDLLPDTTYYFRVQATDSLGQTITSEIFTLHTARGSYVPNALTGTAVISSNGTVVLSEEVTSNTSAGFALLPSNTDYDITLTLPQTANFTSLDTIVQNGLPIDTVSFVEREPGVYVAHLKTSDAGIYQIFLRSTDLNGNVAEQQLAYLKVINPLSVIEKNSGIPITNARVYLTYYDIKTNSYIPLSELLGTITNPVYSDAEGKISILLPPGKYRVDVGALFYDSQTIDFTLGPGNGQEFPQISLTKDPFNIVSLITNIKNLFIDGWNIILNIFQQLASSIGLFTISSTGIIGSFVLLSFLLFTLKSHITGKNLPLFLAFSIDLLLKKHKQRYLFGHIINDNNEPLSRVRIEIEDATTHTIITHTTTHKAGRFYLLNNFPDPATLIFTKEGYEPFILTVTDHTQIRKNGLQIKLQKGTPHHGSVFSSFIFGIEEGFGMLFETFLISSLVLEVLFFLIYGPEKALPFFLLSLLNISLWHFYNREKRVKIND